MRYEAALFDMDGTVLDTLDDLAAAVNRSLAEFGLPPVSRETVRAGLGNGAARLIQSCLPEGTSRPLFEAVLGFYQPWYETHCRIRTGPYEGIPSLLGRLRQAGVKLAVVSNKPDGAVRELAEMFFPGLLTAAVGEKPGIPRKPDPTSALAAAELLGVRPDRCVYIGDSEVDVATAKNAGMDGIAVTWGFRDEEELLSAGAQRLAHNAPELEELLLK